MIPEIDVSSVIAVIVLAVFILINYSNRKVFFTFESITGFMSAAVGIFSLFLSLFLYSLFSALFKASPLEMAVLATVIGVATGAFIQVVEFEQDGNTISDFLYEKLAIHRKFWVLGGIVVTLSVPFVGIFAIQSSFKWGIAWFYGTLALSALILGIEFLWNAWIGDIEEEARFIDPME